MNKISISQAWSNATSFFSGQAANHAIILIGIGIIIPLLLQLMLGGGTAAINDPMAFMGNGGVAAMGGMLILLSIIGYILQMGSYFASWRIGLTNGAEPLGSAVAFGVVAALPVLLLVIVVGIVFALAAFMIFGGAMMPFMGGGQPNESALAGMGIAMLFLVPAMMVLIVWLGARLCCTGPVMAERRSYNILSAMGESWRMTAASQWKIFAYFVLLGIALIVIFMILGMIGAASMMAGGASSTGAVAGILIGSLLVGIPLAYLQVGVPAGIFRALGGDNPAATFS